MQHLLQRAQSWAPSLVIGGFVAVAAFIGLTIAISPVVGVALAIGLSAVLLAPAVQHRVGLPPWWPLLPIAVLQPMNRLRPIPGVTVGDVGLVLLGAVALTLLPRSRLPARVVVPLIGTLVMAAGGLLGTIATQDWGISTVVQGGYYGGNGLLIFKFLLGAPCVIIIVSAVTSTRTLACYLAGAYAVGAAISSFFAMFPAYQDPYFQRAFGLGVHQLHLALTAVFGGIVALGWLISATRNWQRAAATVVGLLNAYGIILSGARSGLLALAAALFFLACVGRARGLLTFLGGSLLAFGVMVLVSPMLPEGSTINRLLGRGDLVGQVELSNGQHQQAAQDAIAEIGQHTLTGLGFGQGLDAHSLLLEAWNSAGVLGVIGVGMIWGTFALLWGRTLRYGVRRVDAVPAALLAGALGYFVLAQLENILWDRHLWFFLTLALLAAPRTRADLDESGGVPDDLVVSEPPVLVSH